MQNKSQAEPSFGREKALTITCTPPIFAALILVDKLLGYPAFHFV